MKQFSVCDMILLAKFAGESKISMLRIKMYVSRYIQSHFSCSHFYQTYFFVNFEACSRFFFSSFLFDDSTIRIFLPGEHSNNDNR